MLPHDMRVPVPRVASGGGRRRGPGACGDPPPLTCGAFLAWCGDAGPGNVDRVALVFAVTTQTLRNWGRTPEAALPRWVALCVRGYEAWGAGALGGTLPVFPSPTPAWLAGWGRPRGLHTNADIGRALGHTRQCIHNWSRKAVPRWVPLACLGYDSSPAAHAFTKERRHDP